MNRLHRRGFLTTLAGLAVSSAGLAVLSCACGLPALVTTRRIPRIGHLRYGPPELLTDRVEAFREGLRELGYIEGQNIAIEWRVASPGSTGAYPFAEMAADLVRSGVEVIVAVSSPAAVAAKEATSTIPIVFVNVTLPIELGLVDSLARPGGNVTGFSGQASGVQTKQLEFLRDLVPGLLRVAYFLDTNSPASTADWGETRVAAEAAGMTPQRVDLGSPEDLDGAVAAAELGRAQALCNGASGMFLPTRQHFAELLIQHRLPAIDSNPLHAEAGMLMTYGLKGGQSTLSLRAAGYVDRILKGARPADLPVQQPTEFDFVVNVKTAQALGISIPAEVAAQVTRWVQ